jgi:hypothetical protein
VHLPNAPNSPSFGFNHVIDYVRLSDEFCTFPQDARETHAADTGVQGGLLKREGQDNGVIVAT